MWLVAIGLFLSSFVFCARASDKKQPIGDMHETMRRVFPLRDDAVDWRSINWSDYSKIIISGPQRSGTTFFAQALASHLNYTHLDENMRATLHDSHGHPTIAVNGGHANQFDKFADVLRSPDRVVMQRPQWSHALHKLPASRDVFVAVMAHNCLGVYRSQNRIMADPAGKSDLGWTCLYGRAAEWAHYHADPELRASIDDEHDMICVIKQQAYQRLQRARMDARGVRSAPIDYATTASMPAFVSQEKRKKLGPKEVGVPRA
jgi:hypothetical protein